jgi:hypothetical protein
MELKLVSELKTVLQISNSTFKFQFQIFKLRSQVKISKFNDKKPYTKTSPILEYTKIANELTAQGLKTSYILTVIIFPTNEIPPANFILKNTLK